MYFRRRRSRRSHIGLLILLVLGALLLLLVVVFSRNIAPLIINLSESKVEALAISTMNGAVKEIMLDTVQYDDLIDIVQNEEGRIVMLKANTMYMNELANRTALLAQERLASIGTQGIGVPIGSAMGGELLAGRGPLIYVRILPVGSVTTEFQSEFENAGINQTRHKIYLVAQSNVRIILPTQSRSISVKSQILISECIIVGEVPHSFVNVDDKETPQLLPDD